MSEQPTAGEEPTADESPTPGEERVTPYELVFGPALFEERRFPAIREEAEARGVDPSDPDAFIMLAAAGALLRDLIPDLELSAEERGEVLRRHARLLFHAYRHWREGRNLLRLERSAARFLVEAEPEVGERELRAPAAAGYLQLPRHLFWGSLEPGATPEPVDGFFWSAGAGRLYLLLVLGLRPGRPGFGSVEVDGAVGAGDSGDTDKAGETGDTGEAGDTGDAGGGADAPGAAPHWASVDARPGGRDFENVLPGGEIESLYALTTRLEALKLASRIFWFVDRHPGALESPSGALEPSSGAPVPPGGERARRIRLGEDDG